ncbi:ABC transporter substrate-binding protein [Streptomyces sp. NPDC050560]|uniref:ABC transporter substrate-binding protein n=1 Tax=Streptomyces sp. NPDC050560 TaxID=3365630 RepID=UPI0037A9FE57
MTRSLTPRPRSCDGPGAARLPHRVRRTRTALAAVAVMALVPLAAGCGGSSSSASSGGSKGTIRLVVSEGNSLPFIAAEAGAKLGVWKDKGINVKIIDATSSTVGPTMASGDADISLQAGNKAAADIIQGLKAKLVAGCVLPWDQYLVAAPSSKAKSAADLKGKKFGISGFGSASHFATLRVAKSLGWNSSDYQIVQMGSLQNLIAGLKNHTIDAFIWSIDPVITAQQQGYGKNLGSVAKLVGPNAFEAFSVNSSVATSRPSDVKAFFKGYYEAVSILQKDPAKAKDVVVNDWKSDPEVADKTVPALLPLLSKDGKIPAANRKGLGDAIRLAVKNAGNFDVDSVYSYWQDL